MQQAAERLWEPASLAPAGVNPGPGPGPAPTPAPAPAPALSGRGGGPLPAPYNPSSRIVLLLLVKTTVLWNEFARKVLSRPSDNIIR